MVATFVWPWKNDDELLEVRSLFYPAPHLDETDKREKQQLAVNIVSHMTFIRMMKMSILILYVGEYMEAPTSTYPVLHTGHG